MQTLSVHARHFAQQHRADRYGLAESGRAGEGKAALDPALLPETAENAATRAKHMPMRDRASHPLHKARPPDGDRPRFVPHAP